jgi:hypothetical protein
MKSENLNICLFVSDAGGLPVGGNGEDAPEPGEVGERGAGDDQGYPPSARNGDSNSSMASKLFDILWPILSIRFILNRI